MNDLITVIIPVYNVEQYLDRCMHSILNQTYENLEIILVDDESKDKSNEMCLEYLSDPRVIVEHGIGEGLSGARNSGLNIAHGKYVVFVDSDDYAEHTMIENLYKCLKDNNADTAIGGFRRAIGSNIEIKENRFAGTVYIGHDTIMDKVLKKMLASDGHDQIEMSVWKSIFSMDIINNNSLRFPDKKYLCEDIIFDFGYFSCAQRVAMSDDTGYCYCLNEESLSQMYQKNKFERITFQTSEMRRLSKEVSFDEEAGLRIDNFYVGNLIHHMKTMAANHKVLGRYNCIKEYEIIMNDDSMAVVNWQGLSKVFKGRDKIPVHLMKYKMRNVMYCYMVILTSIRKLLR